MIRKLVASALLLACASQAQGQSTGAGICGTVPNSDASLRAIVVLGFDENSQPDPASGSSIQVHRRTNGSTQSELVFQVPAGELVSLRWLEGRFFPELEVRTRTLNATSQHIVLTLRREGPDLLYFADLAESKDGDDVAEGDWHFDIADCQMLPPPMRVVPAN